MIFGKSEVSSTKILHIDIIPSVKSYISRIKEDVILTPVV